MERIACLFIGYLFGMFQTSYLIGKYHHMDIRQYGSGNAGTTNVMRTLGKKAGIITYLLDTFKAVFAALAVHFLFGRNSDIEMLLFLYSGFGVVLGHNFPVYLKFKGGKGIAATAGIIFSIDWRLTVLCLAVFILIVAVTRYVSLGSLVVSVILLAWNVYMGKCGAYNLSAVSSTEYGAMTAVIAAMAFWRHRANIIRLIHGNENKVGVKKS